MIASAPKDSSPSRSTQPRRGQPRKVQAPTPRSALTPHVPEGKEREIVFPEGLLGLPACRHFSLGRYQPADGSDSPFFLLQSTDGDLSFPLIEPQRFVSDYQLSLPVEVLAYLQARSLNDLVVLTIVTLRERLEDITVNLQGPLLLNLDAGLGVQLVIERYPVRHAMFVRQEERQAPASGKSAG
jgi:flagellar assembly factor FliW